MLLDVPNNEIINNHNKIFVLVSDNKNDKIPSKMTIAIYR